MNKRLKQLLSLLTAAILIISGLVPANNVFAESNDVVIEPISNLVDEVIVNSSGEAIVLETDISFDKEVYELSEKKLQTIDKSRTTTFQENLIAETLPVTDAKVTLTLEHETNEIKIKSIETDQTGREITNEYDVVIENATQESGIQAKFIDTITGEEYEIDSEEIEASVVWFAIPIGVAIGEALLAHLISIGLATVIAGVTYIAISEFLKRPKSYNHYKALIDKETKMLWVSDGISKASAVLRLKAGQSTWSTSQSNARIIAKEASPIGNSVGPEIDGGNRTGKLYHYHPVTGYYNGEAIRLAGAHAFYGNPQ